MYKVLRRMKLRVSCCYRTTSYDAVAVISGIPAVKLLARERMDMFEGMTQEEASARLVRNWQEEWEAAKYGRWTFRLIPEINKWVNRMHGLVTYHLAQFLTGHGCFGSYLKRFNLRASGACQLCGYEDDDAEHAVLKCDAWYARRREMEAYLEVDMLTPETIVQLLLGSTANWTWISAFVETVMDGREKEERRVERETLN